MQYLLGIDIGLTNLKAKWAVCNPDELWNEIAEAIREVVKSEIQE